jgi:hypothetical protein
MPILNNFKKGILTAIFVFGKTRWSSFVENFWCKCFLDIFLGMQEYKEIEKANIKKLLAIINN